MTYGVLRLEVLLGPSLFLLLIFDRINRGGQCDAARGYSSPLWGGFSGTIFEGILSFARSLSSSRLGSCYRVLRKLGLLALVVWWIKSSLPLCRLSRSLEGVVAARRVY